MPRPTGILTTGLLLTSSTPAPIAVLVAPVAWALVGASAALVLGVSSDYVLTVVGLAELASGVSIDQARDELSIIYGQFAQEFPRTHTHWTLGVQDAREWQYGPMRAPLLMLLAATAVVLLIACVNIGNLTAARCRRCWRSIPLSRGRWGR